MDGVNPTSLKGDVAIMDKFRGSLEIEVCVAVSKKAHFTREELEPFGFIVRCLGCVSPLRRTTRLAHTECCKKGIEVELKGTRKAEAAERRTKQCMDRVTEREVKKPRAFSGRAFENILNMRRLQRAWTRTMKKHRLNMVTLEFVLRMISWVVTNGDRKIYGSFEAFSVSHTATFSVMDKDLVSVTVSMRFLLDARNGHDHYQLPEHSHSNIHNQRLWATSMYMCFARYLW